MDRRVTILESIETKLKTKEQTKLNQFGNRIIENWCAYANKLAQLQRANARKVVTVSEITEKDEEIFQQAYRRLKEEKAKQQRPLRLTLKRLATSRTIRRVKSERRLRDDDFYCTIDYKQTAKPKSAPVLAPVKNRKSKLSIDPEKPKKNKKPNKQPSKLKIEAEKPKKHEEPMKLTSMLSIKPSVKPKDKKLAKKPATAMERPAIAKPSIARQGLEKPAKEKTAMAKPDMAKPDLEKPAEVESALEKPDIEKPAVEKPAVEKPAIRSKATRPKPLLVYPPVKTRPWFPCAQKPKPRSKPVIEYPPLTLRKT